jgi:hypothetical protein
VCVLNCGREKAGKEVRMRFFFLPVHTSWQVNAEQVFPMLMFIVFVAHTRLLFADFTEGASDRETPAVCCVAASDPRASAAHAAQLAI